jgi:hypothetical protein
MRLEIAIELMDDIDEPIRLLATEQRMQPLRGQRRQGRAGCARWD